MPRLEVSIKTRDGNCPASVFTPANKVGPWPAVIFFMDGLTQARPLPAQRAQQG
jgi:carboxymethylenebutenolidase